MVRRWIIVLLAVLPLSVAAQEVLMPLQHREVPSCLRTKEQPAAVSLPFFDDFADGRVNPLLWQQGGATATFDVSPLAPTVGVVTLDALDVDGNLYPQASVSFFPADTLMSLPLRLDSLSTADSVVLSFHYLPGGGYGNLWERVGETPDAQDTLFLDFYRAVDSAWVTVWCRGGISVDTLMEHTGSGWQYAVVPLTDSAWFDSSFRFRFRNYASLENTPKAGKAGNCDYWHLDCIHVDRGRDSAAGAVVRDVAFAAPAPTMLRTYRAMPYRQYAATEMAPALSMSITNRFSSPLATQYGYTVLDSSGNTIYQYDGGFENAPPFLPNGQYQTTPMHAAPAVGFAFPTMTTPTAFTVVHVVREGTGGDAFPLNDTVRYRQWFGDYYAYDDGSPENGYGLTSTASRLFLAYRFDVAAADTLTAVDLYFNQTLDSANAAIPFYLTLWSMGDDGRPAEVLYRDEMRRMPRFGGYGRYVLEAPVVVEGPLFVGFEQSGNDYINLGFDRSLNTADRIWYLTGTEWQQSIYSGSLMVRPAFGAAATVAITDILPAASGVLVYPNPATDQVFVDGEFSRIEIYDMQGRRRMASRDKRLDVTALPDGIYLLRALSATQSPIRPVTLIIKH